MSGDTGCYVTLMSSLPHLGDLFPARQTPCSRYKLEARLKMLSEEDAAMLREIENLLQWSRHPMTRRDPEIVRLARDLVPRLRVKSELLAGVVERRLERRTLIAALRRRKRGEPAPRPDTLWGYGRWLKHINRYWHEPAFRLEGMCPWLPEAARLLQNNESVALERLLLKTKWDDLKHAGENRYFNFEAVVLYVLRWNIVNRWTGYSGSAAAERFTRLLDSGIVFQTWKPYLVKHRISK